MCWAHVLRNVDKRIYVITEKAYRNLIKEDIKKLQKSYCSELFNCGYELLEKNGLIKIPNANHSWITSEKSGLTQQIK
ncbi:unnamed protein product, partial [Brachionus calyciflorus]